MPENRPVKRIGFIGLGDMGLPMACNLLKAGFDVTGFDLRPERLDLLKGEGGLGSESVGELGQNSDVVFVMVMTGKQVAEIILGDNGLLKSMRPGSVIILSSTIAPSPKCLQQRRHFEVGPAISPSLLTSRASGACTAAWSPSSDDPPVPESLALIREAWLNANSPCGEECEPLLVPSQDELPA